MNQWWNNPLAENPMGYNALQDMEAASGLNTTDTYQGTDPLQSGLDVASLVPGVGDIAGPLADLRMMQQNPEKRTLANIALFGLGALPAIPSLVYLMSRSGALAPQALELARKQNTFTYNSKINSYGNHIGFPQKKGTELDKLFSNFADQSTSEAANDKFREGMFNRAKGNPKDFSASKGRKTSIIPFRDNLRLKIVSTPLSGETLLHVMDSDKVVGAARLEKGMLDSIAVTKEYKGKNIGEDLLRWIDKEGVGNIYEVPDRSPGFIKIQKKVLQDKLNNPDSYVSAFSNVKRNVTPFSN